MMPLTFVWTGPNEVTTEIYQNWDNIYITPYVFVYVPLQNYDIITGDDFNFV